MSTCCFRDVCDSYPKGIYVVLDDEIKFGPFCSEECAQLEIDVLSLSRMGAKPSYKEGLEQYPSPFIR